MKAIDFSLIIVNYNSAELLKKCISSVLHYCGTLSLQVIVVDNASSENPEELISGTFPAVKFVRNSTNMGYSRAINKGMELAEGEFCVIMNPDIEFSSDVLSPMSVYLRDNPDTGAAGCMLVFPDGTAQRSFFNFPTLSGRIAYLAGITRRYNLESLSGRGTSGIPAVREVPVVCGAFMAARTEVLKACGGFDPDYFLYHEEADFCYRLNRKGLKNVLLGDLCIIHYGDHREIPENSVVFYHRNRSLLIYFHKHRSQLALIFLYKINVFFYSLQYLLSGDRNIRNNIMDVLKYHKRFWKHLFSSKKSGYPE